MTERFVDLMDRTFSATEREVIYRLIRSRRDIRQFAPDPIPPEALLRILEEKGHLRHEQDGQRYVYVPSTPRADAGASHLTHVIRTFFDGSPSKAMAALLGSGEGRSEEELKRLEQLIEQAKRRKR